MKILYEFTIKDEKKKEHKFRILKPNRRQVEDAEMEYAVEMSKCIKKGILTKTMLAKKYSDTGGLMSEKQAQRLMQLYHSMAEKTNEYSRLSTLERKTKKVKEKMSDIENDIVEIKREVVDIETSNISLFNQTAETKAQNATVRWYTLVLVQQLIKDEWKDVYEGSSYEDKLDFFYEKEDEEDDDIYFTAMSKAISVLALWFFNQGSSQQEFDNILEEYTKSDEEDIEEKDTEKSGEEENDNSDESES